MMLLTIDTAFPTMTVGLWQEHNQPLQTTNDGRRADQLLCLIATLLKEARIAKTDLTGIMVRRGIGSYTGLRVGVTVSLALAWSLGISLKSGYSPLERSLTVAELVDLAQGAPPIADQSPWSVVPVYTSWGTKN